jgi:putative toxin-antitoxin system antitoxin component (TIGR02293 family)
MRYPTGKTVGRKASQFDDECTAVVREEVRGAIRQRATSGAIVDQIVAQTIPSSQIIGAVQAGLGIEEMEGLQAALGLPIEGVAAKLGISKATLHRRKAAGKLDPAESDRVVRFARLMGKAIEVLESEDNARKWLNAPQVGLGGAVPLDYAETEVGAREVEDLLGRIEYGVYS